jgi:hypothetical protein
VEPHGVAHLAVQEAVGQRDEETLDKNNYYKDGDKHKVNKFSLETSFADYLEVSKK